jgi:hypothetical protein
VASTSDDDEKLVARLGHFKQLRKVAGMLAFLHDNGCDRDKAANHGLHFDDYVLLILLWMFNPGSDAKAPAIIRRGPSNRSVYFESGAYSRGRPVVSTYSRRRCDARRSRGRPAGRCRGGAGGC